MPFFFFGLFRFLNQRGSVHFSMLCRERKFLCAREGKKLWHTHARLGTKWTEPQCPMAQMPQSATKQAGVKYQLSCPRWLESVGSTVKELAEGPDIFPLLASLCESCRVCKCVCVCVCVDVLFCSPLHCRHMSGVRPERFVGSGAVG